MQNPEKRPEHREQPEEESIFDRPGPLFPGIVRSKPDDFNQIMRTGNRMIIAIYGTGAAFVVLVAASLCNR